MYPVRPRLEHARMFNLCYSHGLVLVGAHVHNAQRYSPVTEELLFKKMRK